MEIKRYRIHITPQAEQQVRNIIRYIAFDLQNPDAALHMLDLFDQTIQSLQEFPQRISLTNEDVWRDQGIRRAVIQSYLIYFWIDEVSSSVEIIAVIYGKRSQSRALAEIMHIES